MKQNTDKIEVEFDPKLKKILKKIFSYKGKVQKPVRTIIESGTYLGTGSTRELAEIIIELGKQDEFSFYTLEAKWWVYEQAKNNLKKYPFVQSLHALSFNLEEGLDFISNDDMIKNHQNYPDLIIDCTKNPELMYRTELWSCFSDPTKPVPVQGIFYEMLPRSREDNILVLLDACGGTGWFEFNKVMELMLNNHYYLLIDDCSHIKNSRTYQYIEENDKWNILFYDGRVALAEFLGE